MDEEFEALVSMFRADDLGLPVRKNLAGHVCYGMSVTGRIVSWSWMVLFPLAVLVWWRTRWWYAAGILLFAIWVTGPIDDWQCAVIRAKCSVILGSSMKPMPWGLWRSVWGPLIVGSHHPKIGAWKSNSSVHNGKRLRGRSRRGSNER